MAQLIFNEIKRAFMASKPGARLVSESPIQLGTTFGNEMRFEVSGAINLSRVCNPRIDALMEQAARARGPEAIELWRRVESALAAQSATVPLLNWSNTALAGERIGNYQAHPIRGPLLEQLWVE